MTDELGFEIRIAASQDEAIEKVTEALKEEGFGVLTRIDIDRLSVKNSVQSFVPTRSWARAIRNLRMLR